jgi:hypothetical protein
VKTKVKTQPQLDFISSLSSLAKDASSIGLHHLAQSLLSLQIASTYDMDERAAKCLEGLRVHAVREVQRTFTIEEC